jgi:adenylate kinase
MRVILLGAPGAGKGTQCKFIVERYGLLHLSSGDILRRHWAEGTELGKKAQTYMDAGELVPDDLIIEMMIGEIARAPKEGFVLDGFPRTVNQAKKLDDALAARGETIDAIFNLEVDEKTVVQRITGRRSCPKCGAVYHIENQKPEVEGICDNCGTELVQRPDDTEEVVKNRLKNYYDQTEPLVGYYQSKLGFKAFRANGPAAEVRDAMFERLDALS